MSTRAGSITVLFLASTIAVVSAMNYAGSWNDGSRLATVECLVDRHTWVIDDSVFLIPLPYGPLAEQFPRGTLDRLYINGHYYSDKSPVPAVLLAGPYWLWRTCGGPSASECPNLFCWLMTLCSSGVAIVAFAYFVWVESPPVASGGLSTIAICCSTLALPYCRFVNNHEILLGVTAGLLLALRAELWKSAGVLAGLAYATDLGAGPVIALGAGVYVTFTKRSSPMMVIKFAFAALPFALLHHILNYLIGGALGPANANPAYFNWPGCPFQCTNISGAWNHSSSFAFIGYALDLLVGKKGFYGHNPILLLLIPALPLAWRTGLGRLCLGWLVGVWLVYAAGSNNYSGACVSVRWFVPLIAPAYFVVMHYLRNTSAAWRPFCWLAVCGAVLNTLAWQAGPWLGRVLPGYWAIYAVAVLGAIVLRPRAQQLSTVPLARAA